MGELRLQTGRGWEVIGIATEQPFLEHNNSAFLAYDGTLSNEPVDQVYYLNKFFAHASRFAHQLDAAMGHHTLASSSEEDRLTVHNALSAMIGSAWRRYAEWDLVSREELIVGGNYDGTPLWKRNLDDFIRIDEALCGDCDIATFARRFLFKANLPLFRRLHRQGIIYSVDRRSTPWGAQFFDVATQPHTTFYDQLDADYRKALDYYDLTTGAQDHA